MSIHVLTATKYIAKRSDWSMSHLRIQKLIYLAHMFHLGKNEGAPLVDGFFEAWDYGPVHPVLYHKAKIFGAREVKNVFRSYHDLEDGSEKYCLDAIQDSLKDFTGAQLVTVTHREKGAWAKNYVPGARGVRISNEDILEEYHDLWGANA